MSERAEDRILDEAAHWLALLDSGHASATEERAFLEWQSMDPRHRQSILAFRGHVGKLHDSGLKKLSHGNLIKTLGAPSTRRSFIRKGTGLLGLCAAAIVVARLSPVDVFGFQDLVSGTGQRRQLLLPDGSHLLLNARSRVTPDFDAGDRRLQLRDGELQVTVATGQRTPLRIETAAGTVSSLDSVLQVRNDANVTRLLVLSSKAQLTTRDGQSVSVHAGQSALYDGTGQLQVQTANQDATLWVKGLIKVHDQPLEQLIETLRPYRTGIIRISPQAAQLRVSGIYSLDNTDMTLNALRDSLGLQIDFHTDYWVSISVGNNQRKG